MNSAIVVVAVVIANIGACSIGCQYPSRQLLPPAGSYEASKMTVIADGKEESVSVARVKQEFFTAPKVQPMLGRFFAPEEYRSGGVAVGVLAHEYWRTRFGSSPTIVGQAIQLDGRSIVIVGVGPKNFGPVDVPVWVPAQ